MFLQPGREVLVARDGQDVVEFLAATDRFDTALIGRQALARVRAQHTYAHRAATVDAVFRQHAGLQAEVGFKPRAVVS